MKKSKTGIKRKKRKRNPAKTEERKTLIAWRSNALERAGHKCEWCGKEGPGLNAHHIISRNYKPLKLSLQNALILCAKDHKFGTGTSVHQNPIKLLLYLTYARPLDLAFLKDHTEKHLGGFEI